MGGCNAFGDALEAIQRRLVHGRIKRTQVVLQLHGVGHDAIARSAIDDTEAQHGRQVADVVRTADDGLPGSNDLGRGDNGIYPVARHRAVGLAAMHGPLEPIRAGHGRPRQHRHRAELE